MDSVTRAPRLPPALFYSLRIVPARRTFVRHVLAFPFRNVSIVFATLLSAAEVSFLQLDILKCDHPDSNWKLFIFLYI